MSPSTIFTSQLSAIGLLLGRSTPSNAPIKTLPLHKDYLPVLAAIQMSEILLQAPRLGINHPA
jgi:hypothetical protein